MVGITDTKDRKILENTGDLYSEIATNYPSYNYTQLCNQFDVRFAQSEGILNRHLLDYKKAVKEVLNIWEAKGHATRAKLESALKKAETGALCTIVAKHFANVEVHEEGGESDESDEDEVREEEEESDEEPVTVYQRGGAQTINASGRSKVKGSTMTGPVTNMTIYNHPAKASTTTSKSQGRKGKADGSSVGKNRAKKSQYTTSKAAADIGQAGRSEPGTLSDDADNNEGNDDQLTSRKQDSGNNRDGSSFGGLSAPPEIIARGKRALRAYVEAAKAGTKKVFRTQLMLVGQERVGKTSLKKYLTGQGFDENEAITDGVETTNSCEISIEVAKADGNMWSIHKKEEISSDNVEAPKAKEEVDNVPNKEMIRLKEMGLTDSSDSDKGEGVSLSIWDFAGQDIYYTTHQVFLTWRAIYVIVFDLSRSLDSKMAKEGSKSELTCLEFIIFWLWSIYARAVEPTTVRSKNTSKSAQKQKSPPIFIVGTHRESVTGDAKEKKKKIYSAFEEIRESIKKKPFECHVVPKYYAIENSFEDEDEELVALRSHIGKVAMEEPYMGEEIPHRWLLFEKVLAAEKINHMSLDQTKELTKPVGMESEIELLTMLTFYHDLGYVVYYGGIEDLQPLLRDTVILNPQWLIDVFNRVITILDFNERDGIMSAAWNTLEDKGILEDSLIEHMWRDLSGQKEFLVELMVNFDLICEAPVKQEVIKVSNETEKVVRKRYYVPSRLTTHCRPLEEIEQIKSSTDFYVDFKDFLPDVLFHRLMARAVRWMGERGQKPGTLFYRQINIIVDEEHCALLEMLPPHEATIKVTVFKGAVANSKDDDGDNHQPPAPSAVKEVMDLIRETLDSLGQLWIEYDVRFPCPQCGERKRFQDCFKGESIWCGLRIRHKILTAEVMSKFGMSEEGVESWNQSPLSRSNAVHEEPDQATPSGSRSKRRRKPVTVHQSAGDQAINASGRSKVIGPTMHGPVTNNITINYNHPTEASTGQSPGRKRKRVKRGGKR